MRRVLWVGIFRFGMLRVLLTIGAPPDMVVPAREALERVLRRAGKEVPGGGVAMWLHVR